MVGHKRDSPCQSFHVALYFYSELWKALYKHRELRHFSPFEYAKIF